MDSAPNPVSGSGAGLDLARIRRADRRPRLLLTRAADLGARSAAAYWVGLIVVSILFGYGHYYKGPAGMVDSGVAGLILGAAYLLSRRNLWAAILAHGLIDTFAVIVVFLGWDS